jgi:hypothetical protein
VRLDAAAATSDGGAIISLGFRHDLDLPGVHLTGSGTGTLLLLDPVGHQRGTWPLDAHTLAIAALANGDVLVAGAADRSAQYRGQPLVANAPFDTVAFVARLGPDGSLRWLTSPVAAGGWSQIDALDVSPDGTITFGGWFERSLTMIVGSTFHSRYQDGFFGTLDPANGAIRSVVGLENGSSAVNVITHDEQGHTLLAGHASNELRVLGHALAMHQATTPRPFARPEVEGTFLICLDARGRYLWGDAPAWGPNVLGAASSGGDLFVTHDLLGAIEGDPHRVIPEVAISRLDWRNGHSLWTHELGIPDGASPSVYTTADLSDPARVESRSGWTTPVVRGDEIAVITATRGAPRQGDQQLAAEAWFVPTQFVFSREGRSIAISRATAANDVAGLVSVVSSTAMLVLADSVLDAHGWNDVELLQFR